MIWLLVKEESIDLDESRQRDKEVFTDKKATGTYPAFD